MMLIGDLSPLLSMKEFYLCTVYECPAHVVCGLILYVVYRLTPIIQHIAIMPNVTTIVIIQEYFHYYAINKRNGAAPAALSTVWAISKMR